MTVKISLFIGVFLFSFVSTSVVWAALIKPESSLPSKTFEKGDFKVPIFSQVFFQAPGDLSLVPLYLLGSGVREKRVALFTADVYFAKAYADVRLEPSLAFEAAQAAVLSAPKKAIELFFLRDVSVEKLTSAFRESLQENGVKLEPDSPETKVLSSFKQTLQKGQQLTLIGSGKPGAEVLLIESSSGIFTFNGPALATHFFGIWFGRTNEGKMKELQMRLVGKNP